MRKAVTFAAALTAYLAAFPALAWLCTQIGKYEALSAVFCVGFAVHAAFETMKTRKTPK